MQGDIMWLHCSATVIPAVPVAIVVSTSSKLSAGFQQPKWGFQQDAARPKQLPSTINGYCPVREEARDSRVAGEMRQEYKAQRGCIRLHEWWGRKDASTTGLGVAAGGWEVCTNVHRDSASVKLGKAAQAAEEVWCECNGTWDNHMDSVCEERAWLVRYSKYNKQQSSIPKAEEG